MENGKSSQKNGNTQSRSKKQQHLLKKDKEKAESFSTMLEEQFKPNQNQDPQQGQYEETVTAKLQGKIEQLKEKDIPRTTNVEIKPHIKKIQSKIGTRPGRNKQQNIKKSTGKHHTQTSKNSKRSNATRSNDTETRKIKI